MKQVIAFLFVIFGGLLASGQDWGEYSINTEHVKIKEGNNEVNQVITTITNNTDDYLWLFFEPNSRLSDYESVRNKFVRRRNGQFSLFNILLEEADLSRLIPELEDAFVKIIRPHKTFTIVTLGSEYSNSILKRLRLITQREMNDIFRPLYVIEDVTSPIVYKQDVLVIP